MTLFLCRLSFRYEIWFSDVGYCDVGFFCEGLGFSDVGSYLILSSPARGSLMWDSLMQGSLG